MDLQALFYVMAIIFMLSWVVVLIFSAVILWELYSIIKNAPQRIEAKIDAKISELVETTQSGILGSIGVSAVTFIISKIKNLFSRK